MRKRNNIRNLRRQYIQCATLTFAVLVGLMILGSFLDLSISRLLYPGHPTSLGEFFAAFGELPAFTALSCAGCLLLVHRDRINRAWSALLLLCGIGLILMALILSVHESVDSVEGLPLWVALLVTVFVMAVSGVGVVAYARGASTKTVLRFVLTLCFATIGTLVLVNLIKVPWGRARMRLIYNTSDSYFTPWWQAGTELKDRLMASGVSKDEFRSFPSGHTACAACAMLLALLPTLNRSKRKKVGLLMGIGCGWAFVVAVTRIWMGAHFLTDVTMSGIIALSMCTVGVYLFYFNKKFFDLIWNLVTNLPNPFQQGKRPAERAEDADFESF